MERWDLIKTLDLHLNFNLAAKMKRGGVVVGPQIKEICYSRILGWGRVVGAYLNSNFKAWPPHLNSNSIISNFHFEFQLGEVSSDVAGEVAC